MHTRAARARSPAGRPNLRGGRLPRCPTYARSAAPRRRARARRSARAQGRSPRHGGGEVRRRGGGEGGRGVRRHGGPLRTSARPVAVAAEGSSPAASRSACRAMPVAVAVPEARRGRRLVLAFPAEAVIVVLDPLLVLLGAGAPALDAGQLTHLGLGRHGGGELGRAPLLPCRARRRPRPGFALPAESSSHASSSEPDGDVEAGGAHAAAGGAAMAAATSEAQGAPGAWAPRPATPGIPALESRDHDSAIPTMATSRTTTSISSPT